VKTLCTLCIILTASFALLYLGALALYLIGTFGWFGQERSPLSGVFLVPLGLPWNLMLDWAPDRLLPWLAAAAPLVNVAILAAACRMFGTWRGA
jgi:hypothetical protein